MKMTKRGTMIHKIPHRKLLNNANPTTSGICGAQFIYTCSFCLFVCSSWFLDYCL